MSTHKHIEKLPNAPLQEVVFELLWDIENDAAGYPFDPEFEMAQGIFAQKVRNQFPHQVRTIPEAFPIKIYPKPLHQFWKGENIWPVLQIGPGILAVNDIEENYTWRNFREVIGYATKSLLRSFQKQMVIKNVSLKYIDAIEIPDKNYQAFINENFNINLTNISEPIGQLSNLSINETYSLDESGNYNLIITSGISKNNKPAIIWQSGIYKKNKLKTEEITEWLDYAHQIISNQFKKQIKESFYGSFM